MNVLEVEAREPVSERKNQEESSDEDKARLALQGRSS